MSKSFEITDVLSQELPNVRAWRVAGSAGAQAARLSLPLPRDGRGNLVFEGRRTQAQPLAFWPGKSPRASRRSLLFACGCAAGDELGLKKGRPARGAFPGPRAEVTVVDRNFQIALAYEINELTFTSDAGELGIRVGLQTDQGVHWWQWVTMEVLDEGPVCRTLRAQGNIPVHFETEADIPKTSSTSYSYEYPYLHRHNHVRGEVLARCYANGVIELFLRHVNGRFFTEGGDLKNAVPVLGFRGRGQGDWPAAEEKIDGPREWRWPGATLILSSAAHLVSPAAPGRAWSDGGVGLYQPYKGIEVYSGSGCKAATGDEYLCRAEQRTIPKGMARTVRMVASLGAAPADVAVFLMPDWWYGVCEELTSEPLLPVHDEYDACVDRAMEYFEAHSLKGCFDDGAVARGGGSGSDSTPPGWEGEVPRAQILSAYRTRNAESYDLGLRSAYQVTDVATDHAIFAVRMHAYSTGAHSLPMQRILGALAAYLETGDRYLLDSTQAVADTAYWWDRLAWPRRCFGRDAAYIRSQFALYRVLGEPVYLERGREAVGRLIATQHADGSFGDQGNTTGIHAAMLLIVKPWMGCIAAEAMVDCLDLMDDETVAAAVLRFAEWLLTARVKDGDETYWPYQHSFAGGNVYPNVSGPPWSLPTKGAWHVDYLAKILGWASLHTGRPDFYDAWHHSYEHYGLAGVHWDHGANKAVHNVPALRSKLWQARLTADGVVTTPRTDVAGDLSSVTVSGPAGEVRVSTTAAGSGKTP